VHNSLKCLIGGLRGHHGGVGDFGYRCTGILIGFLQEERGPWSFEDSPNYTLCKENNRCLEVSKNKNDFHRKLIGHLVLLMISTRSTYVDT